MPAPDRSKLVDGAGGAFGIQPPELHVMSQEYAVSDNFIGVEQEVENIAPRAYKTVNGYCGPQGWKAVADHSLRDGIELILRGPKVGQDLTNSLLAFEEWFNKHKPGASFRTSTHVHIDFSQPRDTLFLIQDFLMGYFLLEEAFFAFGDPARRYTGYCVAYQDTDEELTHVLRASTRQEMYAAVRTMNRYYACNVQALSTHGTIEFRHLPLTVSTARLQHWINLILRLKRFMLAHVSTAKNCLDAIGELGTTRFVMEVLGPLADELLPSINLDEVGRRLCYLRTVYGRARPNGFEINTGFLDKNPAYKKFTAKIPAKQRKRPAKPKAPDPLAVGLGFRNVRGVVGRDPGGQLVEPHAARLADWMQFDDAAARDPNPVGPPAVVRALDEEGNPIPVRPVPQPAPRAVYLRHYPRVHVGNLENGMRVYGGGTNNPWLYNGEHPWRRPPGEMPVVQVNAERDEYEVAFYRLTHQNLIPMLGHEGRLLTVQEFPRTLDELSQVTGINTAILNEITAERPVSYWQSYVNRCFGLMGALAIPPHLAVNNG